jgi:hypothetical protein
MMSDQMTESQVAKVVAEVTRQAQLREPDHSQMLNRDQVVQILDELKLPVDLLDPAMRELQRREAEAEVKARHDEVLAAKRRRVSWIIGACVLVVLVVVFLVGSIFQRRNSELAGVAAIESGRITREVDQGENLGVVTRNGSELYYRVTLERVPLSRTLSLKCNWIDPGGRVVKQNSWETRTTDKTVWATSCRNTIGAAAQPGTWTVEMLLGDRVVSQSDFRVE